MTQTISGGTAATRASALAHIDVLADLLILSVFAALVLFPALGQTQYLADRELRHAEISREMAERHDYVVPHLVGKPYPEKPPPMHVAAALLMGWWGAPSVLLARWPSALAALGVTLMTYELGRILSDRWLGLVAALGLLAIPGFTIMARQARPDMILCLAITASALTLALGIRECREPRRRAWFVVAGMAAGLGVITKGPYALLFPLFFAVLAPIGRPGWRRPRVEWVGFVAALFAMAAAWAVPAYLRDGGQYLQQVILQEDLDVTKGASHWYSLITPAILLSLPMGAFLPMAIRDLRRHGYSAPLACAAAIFLVVQVIPKKRPHYLLPMYPFLALALAMTIVRHAADSTRIRRGACLAIAVGAAVVPLYFGVVARWVEHAEDPGPARRSRNPGRGGAGRTRVCPRPSGRSTRLGRPGRSTGRLDRRRRSRRRSTAARRAAWILSRHGQRPTRPAAEPGRRAAVASARHH
ncbi:MAG TPA: glycosyltransferase family 39 protein [Candidatus Acidoferrum sp.]|nr:glycosyltransferase family 39 protein [Candidatus Acidoferrum sp.]